MIEVYSPLGIYGMFFYKELTPISTTSGLWSTGNTRKYHQIDVYIYQCVGCIRDDRYWGVEKNHFLHLKCILLHEEAIDTSFVVPVAIFSIKPIYEQLKSFAQLSSAWV